MRRRNILVVYWAGWGRTKSIASIRAHLTCLESHPSQPCVTYWDGYFPFPGHKRSDVYDAIVFHSTFLCLRAYPMDRLYKLSEPLASLGGVKVAIPQDEYEDADKLDQWLDNMGVDVIYSIFPDKKDVLYPRMSKKAVFRKAYAGFVDRSLLFRQPKMPVVDIGYRASSLPYYYGRVAYQKMEIARQIRVAMSGKPVSLDVATGSSCFFRGGKWHDFIQDCRLFLGTESGASCLVDARLKSVVAEYMTNNPSASFDEVERYCLPSPSKAFHALSPKNFECAALRVPQALVRGEYEGVFEAGRHYHPIEPDFSNLGEISDVLADKAYLRSLADRAYHEVALDPRYSYQHLASMLLDEVATEKRMSSLTRKRGCGKDWILLALSCLYRLSPKSLLLFLRAWAGILKPWIKRRYE